MNKKIKILSALVAVSLVLTSYTAVLANSIIDYDNTLYSLVLKSEHDFSDMKFTGNTNNKGTVGIETVDKEHGESVVISAENVENYASGEGPWTQFDGNKSLMISVYELDVYIDKLTDGAVKFSSRGTGINWSLNMVDINTNGIGLPGSNDRLPFEFGVWHKLRFLFDCNTRAYYVYVDNMKAVALSGTLSTQMTKGIQFMRMALMAKDAYAAADNFKNYSLLEIPQGYETPRFTLKPQDGKITESESASIEAVMETTTEIEMVEFYSNDELIYTDAEAPYILENLFAPGEYAIRAVATDVYGQMGEAEVKITSHADTKPRIETNLEDGKEYDRDALKAVLISLSMSEAELKDGNVFADGEKFAVLKKGDNTVDMSKLSMGKHKIDINAENEFGESVQKSVTVTVSKTFEDIVWSADFNDGTLLGQLNQSGQFTRLEVLRDDFGDSLLAGANTTQDTTKEGAWIPISLKNTSTVAITDFDIYFSAINGNGFKTRLNYLQSNRPEIFSINTKGIVAGSNTYPFEAKRWYHITLELDVENASFSLYLDGELIFDNLTIANLPKGVTADSIRAISMLQGTEESYYAIDNIVVRRVTRAPSIVNITSENGDTNTVSSRDTKINVYFSGALEATSVYPAKFSLNGATIKSAQYNADNFSVTLELDKVLTAGEYRLTTAENLVMGSGEIYAEKLYGDFKVIDSEFEVLTSAIDEGTVIADIVNNSKEDKPVYLITNLYDGAILKSSSVEKLILTSGKNSISRQINGYQNGNKAEAFMWDSLSIPVCFMSVEN